MAYDAMNWSKGAIADIRWANNILDKLDMKKPWKFSREMCFRTYLKYSHKVDFQPSGEAHNALDDAINQAKHWIEINNQRNLNSDIFLLFGYMIPFFIYLSHIIFIILFLFI